MPVHQVFTPVHQDLKPVYQDLMSVCQDFMPASQDLPFVKDVSAAADSVSEVYRHFISGLVPLLHDKVKKKKKNYGGTQVFLNPCY